MTNHDPGLIQLMREAARLDDAIEAVKFEASRIGDINKEKLMRLSMIFMQESLDKKFAEIQTSLRVLGYNPPSATGVLCKNCGQPAIPLEVCPAKVLDTPDFHVPVIA